MFDCDRDYCYFHSTTRDSADGDDHLFSSHVYDGNHRHDDDDGHSVHRRDDNHRLAIDDNGPLVDDHDAVGHRIGHVDSLLDNADRGDPSVLVDLYWMEYIVDVGGLDEVVIVDFAAGDGVCSLAASQQLLSAFEALPSWPGLVLMECRMVLSVLLVATSTSCPQRLQLLRRPRIQPDQSELHAP